jgi:hypothetical protein
VHLATVECQIVSEALAIPHRQIASNDLIIQEGQIDSNQDDACQHHFAMLVMS